jgi:trans-2,3-dihydro-3-hydroxyanthranilate isomerase
MCIRDRIIVEDFLDTQLMQRIARQLNLVETVFIKRIANFDFEIRYFTPSKELPIAGHPTVACMKVIHDVFKLDTDTKLTFHTALKEVRGDIQDFNGESVYSIYMDGITHGSAFLNRREVASVFGLVESDILEDMPIKVVDAGLGHIIVPIRNLESLMKAKRNVKELYDLCTRYGAREAQLFTFETFQKENDIHTRNICPREGIEDPACGVGNAALLSYLASYKYERRRVRLEQGYINDFKSVIMGEIVDVGKVKIGGNAVVMVTGEMGL